MLSFGFAFTCLYSSLGFADATQAYYKEITASDGSAFYGESIQQTSGINKLFHQCSMKKKCNFVIIVIATGITTLYNSEDELPQNKAGHRIWKKIYLGELDIELYVNTQLCAFIKMTSYFHAILLCRSFLINCKVWQF